MAAPVLSARQEEEVGKGAGDLNLQTTIMIAAMFSGKGCLKSFVSFSHLSHLS